MIRKYFLVLSLFACCLSAYGQKQLSVQKDSLDTFRVDESLGEKEGFVIVRSTCPLTFDSNMDKVVNVIKTEKTGDFYYYCLKLPTGGISDKRKLRIKNEEYETFSYDNLFLKAGETQRLFVWDKFGLVGVSPFETLRNEGLILFEQCQYEQAKAKYSEALNAVESTDVKNKADITDKIDKADLCINSRLKAEKYYNTKTWCLAKEEYEKVVGANAFDAYCKDKYNIAHKECLNSERIITGTVVNTYGQPVEGVSIAIEEEKTDKKGNVKGYEFSSAVAKTDALGKYQIKALHKTRKIQYWKFSFKKLAADITGDVMNLVVNDGTSAPENTVAKKTEPQPSGASNINNNTENNNTETKSTPPPAKKKKSALSRKN